MTIQEFEVLLSKFIALQISLMKEFTHQFGPAEGLSIVFNAPKTGCLVLPHEVLWEFKLHGVGVSFINPETREVVDVHQNIDSPECFDVWRLDQYVESKFGVVDNFDVVGYLSLLEMEGKVAKEKTIYRLLS